MSPPSTHFLVTKLGALKAAERFDRPANSMSKQQTAGYETIVTGGNKVFAASSLCEQTPLLKAEVSLFSRSCCTVLLIVPETNLSRKRERG